MTVNAHAQDTSTKASTRKMVQTLKATGTDNEWYPTTPEILDVIKADFEETLDDNPSVLDIGCGDGRSLMCLTKGKRYAIEKSYPLLQTLDKSVFIVGTEFQEQTLIDKSVDIIFCNPPFSQFEQFTSKILREGNCNRVYLVLPVRWKENAQIQAAIDCRKAKAHVIGTFDFLSADRAARAIVDIVRIELSHEGRSRNNIRTRVDPFDLWFNDNFKLHINNESSSKYQWDERAKREQKNAVQGALVNGRDIISVLVELYFHELSKLMKNYKALEELDPSILQELDINLAGLKAALRQKVEGLKDRYWKELFDNMSKITSRLTTDARQGMLDKLTSHTHVDFTASNAHAILLWVLKNANGYFDSQLVTLVERMTEQATVQFYKSNQRVYTNEDWRYRQTPKDLNRYYLDYRIVLHRVGGLCTSTWGYDKERHNGLDKRAFELISDILTVASNLNHSVSLDDRVTSYQWESNKAVEFTYFDEIKKEHMTLMVVRAFKNGNLHVRMNQSFICRLNVEFGRLKGWIKTVHEASDELGIDVSEAQQAFASNLVLGCDALSTLITYTPDTDESRNAKH